MALWALDGAEVEPPLLNVTLGERTTLSNKVTDSIPLSDAAQQCSRIRQLSIAELLAETIRRISDEESVSSLFID